MVTEIRELLAQSGVLYTRSDDDPGHLSNLWRKKIERFCDLVETFPLDAEVRLRNERHIHNEARQALKLTEQKLRDAEERIAQLEVDLAEDIEYDTIARRLVDEAVPRMASLNNAMSPGWLARAKQFLDG